MFSGHAFFGNYCVAEVQTASFHLALPLSICLCVCMLYKPESVSRAKNRKTLRVKSTNKHTYILHTCTHTTNNGNLHNNQTIIYFSLCFCFYFCSSSCVIREFLPFEISICLRCFVFFSFVSYFYAGS